MARPRKSADEKRVQVNVRLLPHHRESLAQQAEANERPLASEAEAIIAAALDRHERTSPETRALLDEIEIRITALQAANKGRWHVTLPAWAAVSQMLRHVLDDRRPESPQDDEFVSAALDKQVDANLRRSELVLKLGLFGVSVSKDPALAGISLGARAQRGLLGSWSAPAMSPREWERKAIEALPDGIRDDATALFNELVEADRQVDEAVEEYNAAMKPYWDAEQQGRETAVRLYNAETFQERWQREQKARLEAGPLGAGVLGTLTSLAAPDTKDN